MKRFSNLLFYLILAVVFIFMLNWLIRQMIYPAPRMGVGNPPLGMEEIAVSLSDKSVCYGWLYQNPAADDVAPVILFFHGNGENLQTMAYSGIYQDFQNLGVHFLAMDYPGYGKSTGSASEKMLLEAADSAFVWIADRFFDHPKIICGWSLGAGVAFQTAAKYSHLLDGFIALSPWSSLTDVAAAHYPRWLVNLALRESYNSLEAAAKIQCPALIIHGENDRIIPASQGESVAKTLSNAEWISVTQTGHNDLFSRQIVWNEMREFLNQIHLKK